MTNRLSIDEPNSGKPPVGQFALWNLAFRPFYLGAAIFSALSMSLWSLQLLGIVTYPALMTPLWHAHEMLFGYALAVIVGFLITAARVWSGQPTISGKRLMGLFCVWLLGRILVLTPFETVSAIVNILFPFLAAIAVASPLIAAKNRKNYFLVALLALFGFASLIIHLANLKLISLPAWAGISIAFNLVLLIIVIMSGRVVPMFSNNGVPGLQARSSRWQDIWAPLTIFVVLISDALRLPSTVFISLLVFSIIVHFSRLVSWRSYRTYTTPLVWVLHVAYSWIIVHLLLRVLAELNWVSASVAIHALTVGVIGTLTMGMMVRTSRGHLGLPLIADRLDIICFGLVTVAGFVRVGLPLIAPTEYLLAIGLSAMLWVLAFMLFAFHYGPLLVRPRRDGKPG